MSPILYSVCTSCGSVIAKDMDLETALILMKGLFEEYYADPTLEYILQRQPNEDVKVDADEPEPPTTALVRNPEDFK